MSIGKKIAHKAAAAKGARQEVLRPRHRQHAAYASRDAADQFTGNTKQAGDKVKDAFKTLTRPIRLPTHPHRTR